MKKSLLRLTAVFIIYPYIVGFTTDSTEVSTWSLMLGIGGGDYSVVNRDCNGNITGSAKIPVKDIEAGLEYSKENLVAGVRAGYLNTGSATLIDDHSTQYYHHTDTTNFADSYFGMVTPYVGLRFRYFEVKLGPSFQKTGGENSFSREKRSYVAPHVYLRFGSETNFLVSTSLFGNSPILSGGGWLDAGLGFCIDEKSRTNIWGGVGVIDLENGLTLIKFSTEIFSGNRIYLTGGFGGGGKSTMFSAAFKTPLGF